MTELFKDLVQSILVSKKYAFDAEDAEKVYFPSVVNRALSYHSDCIMAANQMNVMQHLSKKAQYTFLLYSAKGRKRPYSQWVKNVKPQCLEAIKSFFQCSDMKAMEALSILSEAQVAEICQRMDTQGTL